MSPARHPHTGETTSERLDRNWSELLQEVRVAQTGVQILTGFLLTIPFSPRFTDLAHSQHVAYLVVLLGSVVATGLLVGPVAFHRTLFRRGERPWLVQAANWSARAGLVALAATIVGVVWLVFDVVTDGATATIAAICVACFFTLLWGVIPLAARGQHP